ncbi:hypothetical protein BM536_030430 [Streptomyces phaeoluteigriseus]|uniref:LigA protein n=1 Tax=Streptomyces phaeoluteigriseus TaxID=114686 RepID=A0A1V6MJ77_9ACTN|nr:hypothetical protein [Streptomyces phaeoluteigriseus]OQD52499.1 hypothetical protein BM536_030430 [Streptomyces phaeoluteigriseus]
MPVDQTHDPFEDRLSAALHQAGGTFDTDRAALAAAGQVRGHRLRLRRRAAIAGGAAGLALVGVGGALLVPSGTGGSARHGSVAATGSGAPSAVAATPAVPAVSANEMVRTLTELLPEGEVTRGEARGTDSPLPPLAQVVFDDGKGEGAVSLLVDRVRGEGGAFDPASAVTPCPEMELPDSGLDSCVTQTLPDGSVVTLIQGYEYPDRRADTKAWSADLVTPDGTRVSVSEWNAAAQKGEPVSRPEPPLGMEQLKTLAAADEWRRVADAIPEETRRPTSSAGGSTGDATSHEGRRILAILTQALPDGVKVVSSDNDETEFAHAVVDDGKGRSYVQVNLQHDMSDVAGELYGSGAETLPDGTRVATRQGPGEKGGEGVVMWTVDTMRAHGMRVVISAFNSGSQTTAATRPEPALTMAQLRKIALSPQWELLGA